ncbi:hypothetical protein TNCV_4573501, partial [Trichonephila clavipes]
EPPVKRNIPRIRLLKENSRKRTKMPTEQEAKPAVVTPRYSNGGAHRPSEERLGKTLSNGLKSTIE